MSRQPKVHYDLNRTHDSFCGAPVDRRWPFSVTDKLAKVTCQRCWTRMLKLARAWTEAHNRRPS